MTSNSELYCLKWKSHSSNMTQGLIESVAEQYFVDVTLACEDGFLKAHKLVLSTSSIYFKELLKSNPCKHPIIIFNEMKIKDLRAIVDFMYKGEVNISHSDLRTFLKTAETLKVKGLTECTEAFQKDSVDPSGEDFVEVENHSSENANAAPIPSSSGLQQDSQRKKRKNPKNQHELTSSSEGEDFIDIIASYKKNLDVNEEMPGTSKSSNQLLEIEDANEMSQSSNNRIPSPNIIQTRRRTKLSKNTTGQRSDHNYSERQLNILRRNTNESNFMLEYKALSWQQDSESMDNEDQFGQNIDKSLVVYEQVGENVTCNDDDIIEYMSNANTNKSSGQIYACYLCHVTFTAYSSLRRHMKRHCANPDRFECEICQKSYSRKDYMKRHKAKKHGIR